MPEKKTKPTPTIPSPAPGPPAPPEPVKKTKGPRLVDVAVLAKQTGHTVELAGHVAGLANPKQRVVRFDSLHQAASTLHGWKAHKHHTGKPMALSVTDYEKALAAADKPPRGQQKLVPHKPALSKHCPHVFAKEK